MIPLSRATWRRIRALFPPPDQPEVERLLLECCGDNLPFVEASHRRLAERIRFAVLKLSGGDLAELRRQVDEAQIDWRDTLVMAGFAGGTSAHRWWRPRRSR